MPMYVAVYEIHAIVSTDIADDIRKKGKRSRYADLAGVQAYASSEPFEAHSNKLAKKIAANNAHIGARNIRVFNLKHAIK